MATRGTNAENSAVSRQFEFDGAFSKAVYLSSQLFYALTLFRCKHHLFKQSILLSLWPWLLMATTPHYPNIGRKPHLVQYFSPHFQWVCLLFSSHQQSWLTRSKSFNSESLKGGRKNMRPATDGSVLEWRVGLNIGCLRKGWERIQRKKGQHWFHTTALWVCSGCYHRLPETGWLI